MKYFCEACERLVPPASFRLEFGLLVLKCSRCKVEMRCAPDAEAEPAPAPARSKSAGEPLIMLGENEAEPDPIEDEPTRRIAVPAAVLSAIENEAREARRKAKEGEAGKAPVLGPEAKTPVPEPEPLLARSSSAPVKISVPEPERAPAPEPVAAKSSTPAPTPRLAMSEAAAASNLMVLRLSDVKSRTSGGESAAASTPAPAPVPVPVEVIPARASTTQLRVVPSEPSSSPGMAAAPSSSSSEDPFMPPPGYCPKCIGPRKDGAVVCPFCGLDYARFRIEEHRPSPTVASTWLGVVELWESKGAHEKVLALASERGELAGLGRLYRIRLARNPEDAMAKRGREEVLRLASAGSALTPSDAPDKRAKLRMAGLGLLFLFLMVAAVLIGAQVKRMLMSGGAP
ncbi:hypothetical protein [Archangium sp.]|uniref:hypothetical protein n=1 Tax=Archangium sp. TaxID=1872627 RepID=UPI00389B308C